MTAVLDVAGRQISAGDVFVPPCPRRPAASEKGWRLFRSARHNLLAIWPDFTFERGSFSFPIFRHRVHVVVTPDVVREVFVDKAACFHAKSPQQHRALTTLVGDGLIVSDGETWRKRRRVIAPLTHVSKLPELTPVMSLGAAQTLVAWRALPVGAEIDAIEEMGRLTARIIVASIFGTDVDTAAADAIVRSFSVYQRLTNQIEVLPLVGVPVGLVGLRSLRARIAARRVKREIEHLIDAAITGGNDTCSFVRTMTREKGASAIDRIGCRNEAAVIFLAGHETTANTLAWAFFILSQDPVSERRLHEEVDRVLVRPAGFDDLEQLPFARAVIQETLRLYPPVPIQARRASVETAIGGTPVRAGDLVMLNAFVLHRHRWAWSDPDAFMPDRFMPGAAKHSRYAYVPFGIGPRVCTGAQFGLTEAIICLATLSRRFRLRLRPGWTPEAVCRPTLRPGETLPMVVERRL